MRACNFWRCATTTSTATAPGELARLFRHAGLGDDGLATAASVFDEDSQKGLSIGQRAGKIRLSDEQFAEIRAVLARTGRFADPNLILPDIYSR